MVARNDHWRLGKRLLSKVEPSVSGPLGVHRSSWAELSLKKGQGGGGRGGGCPFKRIPGADFSGVSLKDIFILRSRALNLGTEWPVPRTHACIQENNCTRRQIGCNTVSLPWRTHVPK